MVVVVVLVPARRCDDPYCSVGNSQIRSTHRARFETLSFSCVFSLFSFLFSVEILERGMLERVYPGSRDLGIPSEGSSHRRLLGTGDWEPNEIIFGHEAAHRRDTRGYAFPSAASLSYTRSGPRYIRFSLLRCLARLHL